jgi:hypothetical protein
LTHVALNRGRGPPEINMNTTQVIPSDSWQEYFGEVARNYQGWNVTVELLAGEEGNQTRLDGLPLQGISYESKGGSQAGDIIVEAGDTQNAFQTHLVQRPRTVRASPFRPGEELDIEIEPQDGATTLVEIRRNPALPVL